MFCGCFHCIFLQKEPCRDCSHPSPSQKPALLLHSDTDKKKFFFQLLFGVSEYIFVPPGGAGEEHGLLLLPLS